MLRDLSGMFSRIIRTAVYSNVSQHQEFGDFVLRVRSPDGRGVSIEATCAPHSLSIVPILGFPTMATYRLPVLIAATLVASSTAIDFGDQSDHAVRSHRRTW